MTARGLRRLLGSLLAGELAACTAYDARVDNIVERVPPAALVGARVQGDGRLDRHSCTAMCGVRADGCHAATFAQPFPPPRPAELVCNYDDAPRRILPIPPELPAVNADPDRATCVRICGEDPLHRFERCDTRAAQLVPPAPGEVVVVCEYYTPGGHHFGISNIPAGRRPTGFAACACPAPPTELGAYFAQVACLERASVTAFVRLERELAAHGAPRGLCRRARRAAADERRHARAIGRLAVRHLAAVPRACAAPLRPRPLLELAIENALEGCIGESLGALLALRQARTAAAPRLRRTMRAIAADELAHAQLAWDIHAFYAPQLSPADRATLCTRVAAAALARAAQPLPISPTACAALGLPGSPALARAATSALLARLT